MKKPWTKPTIEALNFDPSKHYFIRHTETGRFYHSTNEGLVFNEGIEGAAIFDELTLQKFEPLFRQKGIAFEKVLVANVLNISENGKSTL